MVPQGLLQIPSNRSSKNGKSILYVCHYLLDLCTSLIYATYHMVILDDDFVIKIAAMRAGVADVEFTASKQKYKIAKIEKNNTLLFAFGQKGPLVLTIVSLSLNKVVPRTRYFKYDHKDVIESVIYYLDRGRKMYCCWIRR